MTPAEVLVTTPDPLLPSRAAGGVGRLLEAAGWPLRGLRAVPPEDALAEQALREATAGAGLVAAVGEGQGADVLRRSLARLAGTRLVLSDRALETLQALYRERGQAMPRRLERLALVPQGATVLAAPDGEPGFLQEVAGVPVVVLPAEPARAVRLLRDQVLPRLADHGGAPAAGTRLLRLVGLAAEEVEARLEAAVRSAAPVAARVVEAGAEVWVRLTWRGGPGELPWPPSLEAVLQAALGQAWYGSGDETLEAVVGRLLRARGFRVALAESCTGGLVAHRLTQVPGSSAYLERSLVVYSNAAKQALLGVPEAILREHGAVSAACAEVMAREVRARAGVELGAAVTGIAGPEGGTPAKPVGLTFVALADGAGVQVTRHRFGRDREGNKDLAAATVLDALRRYCLGGGPP